MNRFEVWAWKSVIGLPKTTSTATVMFCCGSLYPSIRILIKQLLYLHKVLQKECDHLTQVTLDDLRERDKGWAKQIKETIETWNLKGDWEVI